MYLNETLSKHRKTTALRALFAADDIRYNQLIWPVFLVEGQGVKTPIESLKGQFHYSIDLLVEDLKPMVADGLGGVILFGSIEETRKTQDAQYAYFEEGLVQCGIRELKKNYPQLTVATDVCLCAYTLGGHCAIISKEKNFLWEKSVDTLAQIALSHARAGADIVAPSAMMDGQIKKMREVLDENGFSRTILMSYSSKFASSMYGPFRDAAGSAPSFGDRRTYQADYRDKRLALRESIEDEAEGADVLMVKPSLFYLDILAKIREQTFLPVAAYNVSGEYAMLIASAERGWGDLQSMVRESLFSLKRAGADIIITYWANQFRAIYKGEDG